MKLKLVFLMVLSLFCHSCEKKTGNSEHAIKKLEKLPDRFISYLKPLNEPFSFKRQENDMCAFRFIWLRTWDNSFIFTLHIKSDTSGILEVKKGNLKGYYPDSLILKNSIRVEKPKVKDWKEMIERLSFWQYKPKGKMLEDAAEWILEGSKDTTYHIVNIQSPDSGLYRDACMDLMKMSGVELGKIY